MKAKILKIIISFIFLFTVYSNTLYAVTNEIINRDETIEDTEENIVLNEVTNEIVEDKKEPEIQIDTQDNILDNKALEENLADILTLPEVEPVSYQGKVCIDLPANQQSFIRPIVNPIIVAGWAVSDDNQATLKIQLDGNTIPNDIIRSQRTDVDTIVSPLYGGIETTPKAGYHSIIEINQLKAGIHTIKVEEFSRQGDLLASAETQIYVENQKYQGNLCIDAPTNYEVIVKPDIDKISLLGWAVSEDSEASVRLLVDGKIVIDKLSRSQRVDVDTIISPSYGGVEVTPMAGYHGIMDIGQLNSGIHTIKVEEISRYGEVICAVETPILIQNRRYQGTLCIDAPQEGLVLTKQTVNTINLLGWAVSEDTMATIKIIIDGKIVSNQVNRGQRTDVNQIISPSYGGILSTPLAGFYQTIDISNLEVGSHQIQVQQISRYGDLIASSQKTIYIENQKYQGAVCLDTPIMDQEVIRPDITQIMLKGWAVSNDSQAILRVVIDGNVIITNLKRMSRPDVDLLISPNYGGVSITPKAGFCEIIQIGHLSKGVHTIRVEELSHYGEWISGGEARICIVNKQYAGRVCIDTPINSQVFTKPKDIKMSIAGWAVSEDSQATIKIAVNGNTVTYHSERGQRPDVDNLISPSYGGTAVTPKAGYNMLLDINNWNPGIYVIRVEQISRYGDLIDVFEVGIHLVNQQYQGQMCVDTPIFYQKYQKGVNMAVGGWAVSQDEKATVEIHIDGRYITNAERYYRGDVIDFMLKYDAKTTYAGYGKLISTAGMNPGTHTVTVYEKSRYGDIIGGIEVKFVIESSYNNNDNNNNDNSPTITKPTVTNPNTNPTSGTKGIDVSQYQGTINWNNVAASGMQYAMIRIGYRGYGTGGFAEDTKFKTNFANAVASGLKVGVYFYSTSINTAEAKQDAEYVISLLRKYGYQNQVSMPIAIDLELISGVNTRDKNVSKSMRTSIANTFCSTIANYGYTPMVYACKSFLNDNMNPSQILYDVWVAQYNSQCTYQGKYTIWQYSSTGKVSGISGNVDCNICYKNY